MTPLNAIDALTPAFTRTHETLFAPFRFGRSWKLAASQYLGFCGSMFLPIPLVFAFFPAIGPMHGFFATLTAIYTLVYLVILYFCARMELVCFEMIVTRAKFVAPMWRRYSVRIWPWIGLKVLVGTVFSLAVTAIFFAPVKHLFTGLALATPLSAGCQTDPAAMQAIVAPFIQQIGNLETLLLAIFLLLKVPSTLLNDFVLPFYVLEDVPLTEALRRGLAVFIADPLHCLLYLILKPILFVIGYIIQSIVTMIAVIPVVIVFVIAAIVGGVTLHHASPGGGLSFGAFFVIAYLVFFGFVMYLSMAMVGYQIAILEALGIYFLGGRYPLLGDMLQPGLDRPFTPPPVFPSEEERKDSDGGPPMPMNPAVA